MDILGCSHCDGYANLVSFLGKNDRLGAYIEVIKFYVSLPLEISRFKVTKALSGDIT